MGGAALSAAFTALFSTRVYPVRCVKAFFAPAGVWCEPGNKRLNLSHGGMRIGILLLC